MIQGNTSTTPLYYTKFPLSKYLEHLFGLSGGCTQGTRHMWNQCNKVVKYERLTSWPCIIFRLDQAHAASIVLDRKQGYGTVTLQINVDVASGSGYSDINQKLNYPSHQGTNNMEGLYWFIALLP